MKVNVLSAILALALAGCGGGAANPRPNTAGAVAPAAVTTLSSTSAGTPAAAPADSTPDLTPEEAVRAMLDARGVPPARREAALAATLRAYDEAKAEIERLTNERGTQLSEEEALSVLEARQRALDVELFGEEGAQ